MISLMTSASTARRRHERLFSIHLERMLEVVAATAFGMRRGPVYSESCGLVRTEVLRRGVGVHQSQVKTRKSSLARFGTGRMFPRNERRIYPIHDDGRIALGR